MNLPTPPSALPWQRFETSRLAPGYRPSYPWLDQRYWIGGPAPARRRRPPDTRELARAAWLARVHSSRLTVDDPFKTLYERWQPLALGVGSVGAYVQSLDEPDRGALRKRPKQVMSPAPLIVSASAWCLRAELAGPA